MMRLAMSDAAAGLLRALLGRSGVPRNRILLTRIRSVDWQSLTFVGERHELELRIPGPGSDAIAKLVRRTRGRRVPHPRPDRGGHRRQRHFAPGG